MLHKKPRIAIIGATSLIAVHCARLWLKAAPADLVLVGRDAAKMLEIAADLQLRSPESTIQNRQMDFTDPLQISRLVDSIVHEGPVDVVLIAHGMLPDQPACQQNLELNQAALILNGVSPVLFAEAFATRMQNSDTGTLILIGSVAGDRGRKSNYIYGSAKGLVARYAQGLQHRLADSGVRVVLVKPGPTDTPMTRGLQQQGGGRFARAEDVAGVIVKAASQGKRVVYAPAKWRWIMLTIQHLPYFLFKRFDI